MPHARPWHRGSTFGDGPRAPLCRERRAVWRARLQLHRRAGRLTALHEVIGLALLRRLGEDGRLDPTHETIADDAACSTRTVRRALDALRDLGLVVWVRRLVREGWRAAQTSNGYRLTTGSPVALPPPRRRRACDGQDGRGTRLESLSLTSPPPDPGAVLAAREALARVAERRAASLGLGRAGAG